MNLDAALAKHRQAFRNLPPAERYLAKLRAMEEYKAWKSVERQIIVHQFEFCRASAPDDYAISHMIEWDYAKQRAKELENQVRRTPDFRLLWKEFPEKTPDEVAKMI